MIATRSSHHATDGDASPKLAWEFHVFVVGRSAPHSARAILNLRRIFERHLRGRYVLQVIDLRDQPGLAVEEQLIVIPAVVRKRPEPHIRVTGDFSDEARVVGAFGIEDDLAADASGEGEGLG